MAETLLSLLQIKNQIVGNKKAKQIFLSRNEHVKVLDVLAGEDNQNCDYKIQAAEILAILANDDPAIAKALLESTLVYKYTISAPYQCQCRRLDFACLKLLRSLYTAPQHIAASEDLMELLVTMMSSLEVFGEASRPDQLVMIELAKLVVLIKKTTGVAGGDFNFAAETRLRTEFLRILRQALHLRKQGTGRGTRQSDALLEALIEAVVYTSDAEVLRNMNFGVLKDSKYLLQGCITPSLAANKETLCLLELTRSDSTSLKLAAIELLCHVNSRSSSEKHTDYNWKQLIQLFLPLVTPFLAHSEGVFVRVGGVMALMCRDDEKSSRMLMENGIITNIVGILESTDLDTRGLGVVESMFLLLASVAAHGDNLRQGVYNSRVLTFAVRILNLMDSDYQVRKAKIAAYHLVRALSRSVNLLRTGVAFEEVTDSVLRPFNPKLNTEPDLDVQAAAMAVVCNLILEFSPTQRILLENGILDYIVQCVDSPHDLLRQNSTWALKHAAFEADESLKTKIMHLLGINRVLRLCEDSNLLVQEQVFGFLRNYLSDHSRGIDFCISEIGYADFLNIIRSRLQSTSGIKISAIYVLVHMAAGSDNHRATIMEHGNLLTDLLATADAADTDQCLAIIWLVMNLTSLGDLQNATLRRRKEQCAECLVELGFKKFLERCSSSDPKVSERAHAAMMQLSNC